MKSFNLLKEYKQQNGHVKVPIKHIEQGFKLGSWLKTQITQYRNKQDGKQPALCDDRARMLEEIGVQWGQKRLTTPWDARYEDLLDFKRRFGHVNVPWQVCLISAVEIAHCFQIPYFSLHFPFPNSGKRTSVSRSGSILR
jgi:hypothetical protein